MEQVRREFRFFQNFSNSSFDIMSQLPQLIIGKIPILVCLPYFYRNPKSNVSFTEGPPSHLNQLLVEGKIHAAPTSSILYARNQEDFLICPEIGTSSALEIHSVLLCSQKPIEQLDGCKIWLSQQSATSILLFKLLCQKYLKIKPEFTQDPFEQERCLAEILIGDQALAARHSGKWPYIYELDRLWREWQGLPFVFGLWTLRKDFITNNGHIAFAEYFQHLKTNLVELPNELDTALQNWQKEYQLPLDQKMCKDFLGRMDYILDDERIRSLQIFYDECFKADFLPQPVTLNFWNPSKEHQ